MRTWKEAWASPIGKALTVLAAAIVLLFFSDLREQLLGPAPFFPHKTCYMNDARLIWLHVSSDTLIGLAYVSISLTLVYLVQKANVPFHLAFIAFGVFIGACGCTHFMEVWTVWEPHYWLAGIVKVITAAASVLTAVWLYPLLPQAFSLIRGGELAEERRIKLEAAHKELEAAHQQLQAAHSKARELDQLKTDFFSNVSHELRTPLALILGPTRQILNSTTLPEAQRHSLESIERNAHLLLKHVNDLLDLSKLDARRMVLNYSAIDLTTLVKMTTGYFDSLARERNISLSVDAPAGLYGEVDVEKLQRILFNLLSNAFKFVSDGGKVCCAIHSVRDHITISVQDNGPGVPPQFRREIFERFHQISNGPARTASGTGLGLSIVKEFVQLHGGVVSVSETPGGGATFTVDIPAKAPAGANVGKQAGSEVDAQAERMAISALAGLRPVPGEPSENDQKPVPANPESAPLVLVVEDNPDMSRFIAGCLSEEYRVETASNGAEGIEKATALRPDVIVSDVMMPVKSGDVMLNELREIPDLKNTPVVMLTAKADDEMRIRLLRQGAQDYMMKPILPEELMARVGNMTSIQRTRAVLQSELASTAQNLEALARQLASKQREAQSARLAAEKANRAKDEFLMTLSHELRTPLTSIFGWVRMIKIGGLDAQVIARGIDTIERNVKLQMQLIEDLLDFSRIVAGKLRLNVKMVELSTIVSHALDVIQPSVDARGLTLNKDVSTSCLVSGDADRLQQIAWNLLSNAVKFTPQGGKVTVSLKTVDAYAELRIADTGQGISPEFFPHIFEKFRQADSSSTRVYGGLGLGLALVRHLAELHGGTVRAESSGIGKGSTFIVTLPLAGIKPQDSLPAIALSGAMPNLSGTKVLLVEDEEDTREFLAIALIECGCNVVAFELAREALEYLKTNSVDVIISDIGLPDEDGLKFIRKVRALPVKAAQSTPAVALTAFAGEVDRSESLAAGFQLHIAKPIDPATLAATIESILPNGLDTRKAT
jgi:signal transduction histidine kinase